MHGEGGTDPDGQQEDEHHGMNAAQQRATLGAFKVSFVWDLLRCCRSLWLIELASEAVYM